METSTLSRDAALAIDELDAALEKLSEARSRLAKARYHLLKECHEEDEEK